MSRIEEYLSTIVERSAQEHHTLQGPIYRRDSLVLNCGCLLYTWNNTPSVRAVYSYWNGQMIKQCTEHENYADPDFGKLQDQDIRPRRTVAQHQEALARAREKKQDYYFALLCGCAFYATPSTYLNPVVTCPGRKPELSGCKLGRSRARKMTEASVRLFWERVRDQDIL